MKQFALILSLLSFSTLASEGEFHPSQCNQIKDVHVNPKPTFSNEHIAFVGNNLNIKLSASGYWVNEEAVLIKNPAKHYQLVQSFFNTSASFSQYLSIAGLSDKEYQNMTKEDWKQAYSNKDTQEFYKKSVEMCRVILDLNQSNNESLKLDKNFIAGINVELKGE